MTTLPLRTMRLPILAAAVFLVACGEAPSTTSEAEPAHTAPLSLSVEGPATVNPGDELTLKVTLLGHLPPGATTDLRLTLPDGVKLLDGAEAEQPMHAGETRLVHVRVDTPPEARQPLIATASLQGDGFGVTSRGHYRFGHAAPKLAQPKLFKR